MLGILFVFFLLLVLFSRVGCCSHTLDSSVITIMVAPFFHPCSTYSYILYYCAKHLAILTRHHCHINSSLQITILTHHSFINKARSTTQHVFPHDQTLSNLGSKHQLQGRGEKKNEEDSKRFQKSPVPPCPPFILRKDHPAWSPSRAGPNHRRPVCSQPAA